MDETYVDEDGLYWQTVRLNQQALRAVAAEMVAVDGIPLDVAHMSIHRLGTFSLKENIEGVCGIRLRDGTEVDHDSCAVGGGRSSDAGRKSVMIDFKHQTNGYLTEDSFDDYDTARHWLHP